MPAYLIAHVEITDPVKYREYTKHTPRAVAAFGGRFIVRAGESVTLEGAETGRRIVVMEFPSLEQVKAFYHSPEYTRVRAIRADAGAAHIVAIDGFPDADWQQALAASRKESL